MINTTLTRLAINALTNLFFSSEDSKEIFWQKKGINGLLMILNSYDEEIVDDGLKLLHAFVIRKSDNVSKIAKEQDFAIVKSLLKKVRYQPDI